MHRRRRLVLLVLLVSVLSLPAAEPIGPKPPLKGAPAIRLGQGTVVFYPVPDQVDVPTTFPGNEVPDPIPKAKKPQAGYPLTVTFGPRMVVTAAKGKLFDDSKQEVPAWFSSPQEPANPNYKTSQQNSLCLFPISPLKPATTYNVQMECKVDGVLWKRSYQFKTAPDSDPIDQIATTLEQLNQLREAAGVEKVELDEQLCKACQAHARYLAKNLVDNPNLNLRDEDPNLPGATPEGRRVAPKTVTLRGMVKRGHLDFMFGVYTNRAASLYPGLKKVGLGVTYDPAGAELWVLDFQTHAMPFIPPPPTVYPGPDQQEIPLYYPSGATQHPVPDEKARDRAGFAITALCWTRSPVNEISAKLFKNDSEIECWKSSPSEPAVPSIQQNSILLIPREPLEAKTTYEVRMAAKVDGKAWSRTWKFTTAAAGGNEAERRAIENKALNLLNAYRVTCGLAPAKLDPVLSAACEKHAMYLKRHLGHPSTEGLGMHHEDPKFPGYTPDGAKAGKEGVITIIHEPLSAVPAWIDTLYHRIPLIDPRVVKVGFGYVPLADGRWICVMHARP